MSIVPGLETGGDGWLGDLLGEPAAQMLTTYAVPCLHYAHWQALWRFRLADWTNDTTYGTDRYHCLCATLGRMVSERLPRARVNQPVDRFGTPFTIASGNWLVYPWRYGRTHSDKHTGLRFDDESWIRSRIVIGGEAPGQGVLEYEGLPAVPLSNVVILAWAGNRHQGLVRAFLASPYLEDGKVCWRELLELDVEAGRDPYGLPEAPDPDVPEPPAFEIELIDRFRSTSASNARSTGTDG